MTTDDEAAAERVKSLRERAKHHLSQWRVDGDASDRDAAIEACEDWLSLEPESEEALGIQRSLQSVGSARNKFRLALFFAGVGMLSAVAAIGTLRVLDTVGEKIEQQKLTQLAAIEWLDFGVAVDIPSEFSDLEGLVFETRSAKFETIEDEEVSKLDLVFTGYLHNRTQWHIRDMVVRVDVLDLHGDVVWTEDRAVVSTLKVACRPGDAVPLSMRFEEEASQGRLQQAESVRITPTNVDLAEPPESYPKSHEIELQWLEEQTSVMGLRVWERSYSVDEAWGRGVYVLQNTGAETIGRLKLEFVWSDSEGQVVAREEMLPGYGGPEFRSGDAFVFKGTFEAPGVESRPEVYVLTTNH
jgi:hypothetical protein